MANRELEAVKERLRQLMEKADIAPKPLAKAAGLGETAVRDLLEGYSNNPRLETLQKLADYFEVPIDNLIRGGDVPVVSFVGAGGEVYGIDDHAKGGGMYHVPALPDMSDGMVGLEVRGDSMYPLYKDGHVLFVKRETDGIDPAAINELSVVGLSDGRTLVKELRRGTLLGTFDLISFNAPPIEGCHIDWATPVRGALTTAGRS